MVEVYDATGAYRLGRYATRERAQRRMSRNATSHPWRLVRLMWACATIRRTD